MVENLHNLSLDELIKNEEVIKITKKAASRFTTQLSPEEVDSCILNAIWKARSRYRPNKGTKFSTYLFQGVRLECIELCRFNFRHKTLPLYDNTVSKNNPIAEMEFMDEISQCDDPDILIERFVHNCSLQEIAAKRGVSGETIRLKLKKNLEKIKNRMIESV